MTLSQRSSWRTSVEEPSLFIYTAVHNKRGHFFLGFLLQFADKNAEQFWLARLGNFDHNDGKFLEGHVTYEHFSAAILNMSDIDVRPLIHLFANWRVSNIFQPFKLDGLKFGRCILMTLSLFVHHFRIVPSSLITRKTRPFLGETASKHPGKFVRILRL